MFSWFHRIVPPAEKNTGSKNPELGKVHLQKAQTLVDEGRFETAVPQFNLALKHDANLIEAWVGLGKTLFKLGRLQDAKKAIAQGISGNSQTAPLNFLMGTFCLHDNELEASVAFLQRAIELDPADVNAHNNLGVAHQMQGDQALAAACFKTAVEINPQLSDARFNLGTALKALGEIEEAIGCYRQTLLIAPGRADAHNNLGSLLFAQANHHEAADCFRQAITANPRYAEAYFNLGNVLRTMKCFSEAADQYRQALALKPDYMDAHINLGAVLQADGKIAEAVAWYRGALTSFPTNADLYCNLGAALGDGRSDEAIQCYRDALSHDPGHIQALINLGAGLHRRKEFDDAIAVSRRALALNPQSTGAQYNLGRALLSNGNIGEAVESFRAVLKIDPTYASAWINLGVALQAENKTAEAISCFRRAVVDNPDNVAAHINLAVALQDNHEFGEAIALYNRALEIDPTSAEAHCYRGLLRLLMADFSGWEDYEFRFKLKEPTSPLRRFAFPRWHRHFDLRGKSILLHADQGLGDTLQFARYVELVAACGAVVYLEVQPQLLRLFNGFPNVARVFPLGVDTPACDYHCPLASLPFEFQTTLDSMPGQGAYLKASTDCVNNWRDRLSVHGSVVRVGVVWSGGTQHKNDHNRSIPLTTLLPLFATRNCHFYSLQKDVRETDLPTFNLLSAITDLAPQLHDFGDTAAAIANLDLVVSVDTSVAHLAGALGKPVWIMVPDNADFRWLVGRTDSPWYSSARLFRQSSLGDWSGTVAAVRIALIEFCAESISAHESLSGR